MPELEFQMTGMADLLRQLDELPKKLEANILRGAIRAGAKPIVDDARRRAPVLQEPDPRRIAGALKKSIRARSVRMKNGSIVGGVTAGGGNAQTGADPFYAVILEYGKTARTLHPFLRPAADARTPDAIDATAQYIRDRIEKEALK